MFEAEMKHRIKQGRQGGTGVWVCGGVGAKHAGCCRRCRAGPSRHVRGGLVGRGGSPCVCGL